MPRNTRRDLLLLTALCWAIYCLGLTTHGLTNWQEAQRAIVAQEMQARGEWIVPTVDGRPYLAKPPMMYWWQLALAQARGVRTGEFELRLTVALAGWLGVLATYILARRLEGGLLDERGRRGELAWYAALFLATGILYVRSSRVGELDILLAPFTVIAIAALHAAWRTHLDRKRTHFPAIALAIAAATGAMLTKGPPGILALALAAYAGIALWHARESPRPQSLLGAVIGAPALLIAALAFSGAPGDINEAIGLVLYAPLGAAVGYTLAGLLRPAPALATFRAYSRTHPIAVIGIAFFALWAWGQVVAQRIGPEALAHAVRTETADNLRAFVLESPLRNLSASAFGVGIGSITAIGAAVWVVRRRIPLTPERALLLAWVIGGLIAFSILGKGVGRYLTPLWPGIAIAGALWWTITIPKLARPHLARRLTIVAILALALGQTLWYGWAREALYTDRSPRAFITELLAQPGVSPDRLAMFEFETPAIDFYAGAPIESLQNADVKPWELGQPPHTLEQLRAALAPGETYTLLTRRDEESFERIRAAGFDFEEIPLTARFTIDNRRGDITAVRITPRPLPPPPHPPSDGASPPAPSAASDPPA